MVLGLGDGAGGGEEGALGAGVGGNCIPGTYFYFYNTNLPEV